MSSEYGLNISVTSKCWQQCLLPTSTTR